MRAGNGRAATPAPLIVDAAELEEVPLFAENPECDCIFITRHTIGGANLTGPDFGKRGPRMPQLNIVYILRAEALRPTTIGDSVSKGKPEYLSGTVADQPTPADMLDEKRVLMFLAEGFDDAEAAVMADVLGWTRYRPTMVRVDVEIAALHEIVHGAFGSCYKADVLAAAADMRLYDALVVPGGFHNLGYEEAYCSDVRRLAREAHERGLPIATMCVGVLPVAEAGVLDGRFATTFALSSRHDNEERLRDLGCSVAAGQLVVDGGVISCSGPAQAESVAYELLRQLAGSRAADEIANYRRGKHADGFAR